MATSRSEVGARGPCLCARTAVRARPHRQPRRDRPADHPGLPRDGDGGDRRLQRRGRPGPARPGGRPSRSDRTAARHRELPSSRRHRRGRPGDRRRRRSIPATVSSPSVPRSPRPSRKPAWPSSGRTTGRSLPSATSWRRAGPRRRCRRARSSRAPSSRRPSTGPTRSPRSSRRPSSVGFPLLVKAAAGGGGRGMRRVVSAQELPAALVSGSREAASAFGDGSVYLEREILPGPAHRGPAARATPTARWSPSGERDCSLQRRHQKLIEEAPAPGLTEDQRRELHALAVRVASAAGLRNAATCEFLYDADGRFWFLEVNTRLQVEHGVTELVVGSRHRPRAVLAGGRSARCPSGRSRPRPRPRSRPATRSRSACRPRTRLASSRPRRAGSAAG